MDILVFFNIILLINILYTLYKEDKVIENFEQSIIENKKIEFATNVIRGLTQADPKSKYEVPPDYTLKVDRLWIDDELLIESVGKDKLRVTQQTVKYSPYTN
jgi:hypothetical protein